jgi:hypothetical protein
MYPKLDSFLITYLRSGSLGCAIARNLLYSLLKFAAQEATGVDSASLVAVLI